MKYRTIVIDPPWDISMAGTPKSRQNRAKKLPYNTMSIQQIKDLKFIEDMAEVGAHVYLWATNRTLRDAFDILESWGVRHHLTLVWCKPSCIAPVPTGYAVATEFCLLGFYGRPMQKFIPSGAPVNHIKAFPKRHSEKPAEFYDMIRRKSPEPRIDIFARKRHYGFDAWGNQVESEIQEVLV